MIDTLWQWAQVQIASNDIFAGLVGGSLFASVLYGLRSVPNRIWRFFLLRCTCTATVFNDDEAFTWLAEWLAKHDYARRCRRLKLATIYESDEDRWSLSPGPGEHFFFHEGRPVWLHRETVEGQPAGHRRHETITVRVFSPNVERLRRIIDAARGAREGATKTPIYSWQGYWRRAAQRLPRDLASVVLPEGQVEAIVKDATWFFGAVEWYEARGVPYRRGFLFEGPPGCGKTSLVIAMASHFRMPVYALNLGSIAGDSALFDAMSSLPARCILLIEDVDAAGATKSRKPVERDVAAIEPANPKPQEPEGITMSGFLNALDGVTTPDGRLLVMTTNHPERIDSAVIRPGRVDRREHIGPLEFEEGFRLYRRFFPEYANILEVELFRQAAWPIPAADLQSVFMRHADDLRSAILFLKHGRAA